MNPNVIARCAGTALAAALLVGAGAASASADEGPLVKSDSSVGVSVGSLLNIGAVDHTTVGGHSAGHGHHKGGPGKHHGTGSATADASVNTQANVGVDLDVVADITAGLNALIHI
ncbi:hypothetical protein [Streptomyces sp. NPDC050738]|uniref:hypothetical protein n=1 Tax=Streptomyces sp. NPDC050738 TaxID=3154744 RepID=UPI003424C034